MCHHSVKSNRKSTWNPFGATELAGAHNAHNHPSGVAEPSRSDEALTQALKQALALVDVKVLDHFVIGGGAAMSFAERGLI
jgi:DNA repair protein RadC